MKALSSFQNFLFLLLPAIRRIKLVLTLLPALGSAIAQAVSRWLLTAAARGSSPGLIMWDLWWDKVALGQVFS
jgi:hypothetical protein